MVFEVSGAVADAEFACLSSISLADTDFFVKFFEESLLFQHIECRNKIAITCTAGIDFFYRICHFYHFSSLWNVLLNVFSQYTNICFSNIRTTNAKLTGKFYLWNIRYFLMELLTDIRIYQHRVHGSPDTVHHHRISAILKIQITTNIVNYNKILMDTNI